MVVPEISRFFGIVIAMYYNDHSPAHFHARYGALEGVISIGTGDLLAGNLPARVLALIDEWRSMHRDELLEDWALARERRSLRHIAPLE